MVIHSSHRKITVTGLFGFEQTRVLDGDDGLVRKSLEQIDLSVGELTDFGASDSNHADCLIHAHQKDGQGTARELNSLGLGLRIGDLDRSPIEHGTSGDDLSR